jgi:hypothetical protein
MTIPSLRAGRQQLPLPLLNGWLLRIEAALLNNREGLHHAVHSVRSSAEGRQRQLSRPVRWLPRAMTSEAFVRSADEKKGGDIPVSYTPEDRSPIAQRRRSVSQRSPGAGQPKTKAQALIRSLRLPWVLRPRLRRTEN